jgi:large subunit ribosomal protein L25
LIRYLPVRTDSHHIPTHFDVDVKELNLGQYKKLADLSIPANMRPLVDLNEVAVVIVRR